MPGSGEVAGGLTRRAGYDCGPLALNTRPARSNRSYEDDRRTFAAHFEQCGTSSYPVRRHLR